jgi:hypothetical protein
MTHPRRPAPTFPLFLAAAGCALLFAASADARPPHLKALAELLGPDLSPKLKDCRTCHTSTDPEKGVTHNAFGKRLRAVRAELRKAGKSEDIVERILAVADEDSDGDGAPNLLELLTGHRPGDPDDRPTETELVEGRKKLAAFLKERGGYPWRPFEKVARPPVPTVKNTAWVRNPIDAFVAAEHEARGLKPRPEAPKAVLLRRVFLDLTGLPPTPEELHAFLDDKADDAYEKAVDRLLASPRYGERWGRHWMDVWRYSDWAGYGAEVRDSQPHIWRWRDWIIESLNEDKGYDRMIVEMLAADEASPDDPKALRATGYLARNWKRYSREKWLQDTVEHTFLAFQGVTLGCARCHDHMFDPIRQKEYYQVRAIFEPHQVRLDRLPGEADVKKDGLARVYDADLAVPTYLFIRGDDRNPDKSAALPPGVPELLGGTFQVEEVKLPASSYAPDRRAFVLKETRAAVEAAVAATQKTLGDARQAVAREKAALADSGPWQALARLAVLRRSLDTLELAEADAPLAEAKRAALTAVLEAEDLEEAGRKDSDEWKCAAVAAMQTARQAGLLEARRGVLAARQAERAAPPPQRPEAAKKTAAAEQAVVKAEADAKQPPSTDYPRRPQAVYPKTSTGRRLAFARWLASRDNPLTARVAVNHIWMRHFGQPLAPSVFDFGRNGRAPSHPALLDWLAAEFMDGKWSMKRMHRLIVTSSAYRLASTPDEEDLKRDEDNRYLWRMNSRRLEAEAVRDGVFYVAGRLDLTMGGPEIDHTQGMTAARRSLYFRHAAEKQMEFLKLFDAASVTECYQRKDSILPQQALALSNSDLALRHSRILARALHAKVGADDEVFTAAAFERVLSRPPTAEEKAECVAFLKDQTARHAAAKAPPAPLDADGRAPASDPALRAREGLAHVLLNHHEFVTVR